MPTCGIEFCLVSCFVPGCGRGSPARVGTSMGPVPYRLLPGMPRQLKAAGESHSKDITNLPIEYNSNRNSWQHVWRNGILSLKAFHDNTKYTEFFRQFLIGVWLFQLQIFCCFIHRVQPSPGFCPEDEE